MSRRQRKRAEDTCPQCGARFRAGRLACPECGSDAETGWRDAEDIDYHSVEIPDTWDELTGDAGRAGPSRLTIVVAILLVAALVLPFALGWL